MKEKVTYSTHKSIERKIIGFYYKFEIERIILYLKNVGESPVMDTVLLLMLK